MSTWDQIAEGTPFDRFPVENRHPRLAKASGDLLTAEQLSARIAEVRDEVARLECSPIEEGLASRVGASVADAQKLLEAERVAAAEEAATLLERADALAALLLADAESETRALRAVTTWLRYAHSPQSGDRT